MMQWMLKFSGFALTGGLALMISTTPGIAASLYCQGEHFHYGTGDVASSKRAAESSAVASWAGFTAFEYGGAFGDFRKAYRRELNCSQVSGGWQCSAKGIPCRQGTSSRKSKRAGG